MIDEDEIDYPDPDDYYDDNLTWFKDEPDCYACNDTGAIYPGGKRCRSCCPTRLQIWWSNWRWRRRQRWMRDLPYSDQPPF